MVALDSACCRCVSGRGKISQQHGAETRESKTSSKFAVVSGIVCEVQDGDYKGR